MDPPLTLDDIYGSSSKHPKERQSDISNFEDELDD
jgi:hypothetical protein